MSAPGAALVGLGVVLALTVVVWAVSRPMRDVSIVDIAWGWLVVTPGFVVAMLSPSGPRASAVLTLATAWALRLSLHIWWRHRGQPEDHRYQSIRARNEPHFEYKSLYLVFGLQAFLGWIVALPIMGAVAGDAPWRMLDLFGLVIALFGLAFEIIADAQLAGFKADPGNRGQVMAKGLWRFSRHPNYFGEFCLWWGAGLVAVSAGAWWAPVSPLLMTVLLLRVSGVSLLEKDIGERRPAYRDYIRRTNAFFPGSPRS